MMEGGSYTKTITALNLLIGMFALYLVDQVYGIIMAVLQYRGIISSSSIVGPTGNINQVAFGTLCLVTGVGCLLAIGVMVLIIMTGVNMIMSKREVQEIESVALPAGIMMIIAGGMFIIPCLSIFQPVIFLIALIMYLRKLTRPGIAIFLYIGAAGLGLAFLISLVGAIASWVTMNTLLSLLTTVVAAVIDMICYGLFLVATLNAKGNRASWHKVAPFMGLMPPGYYPPPGSMYPPGPGGYPGYPPPGTGVYPGYPPHGGSPSQPGQAHPPQYPPQYR